MWPVSISVAAERLAQGELAARASNVRVNGRLAGGRAARRRAATMRSTWMRASVEPDAQVGEHATGRAVLVRISASSRCSVPT